MVRKKDVNLFRIKSCPTGVYQYIDKTDTVDLIDEVKMENIDKDLILKSNYKCTYCQECVLKSEEFGKKDLVSIKELKTKNGNTFLFHVESTGALKPEDIVLTAFGILQDKLKNIGGEIEKSSFHN